MSASRSQQPLTTPFPFDLAQTTHSVHLLLKHPSAQQGCHCQPFQPQHLPKCGRDSNFQMCSSPSDTSPAQKGWPRHLITLICNFLVSSAEQSSLLPNNNSASSLASRRKWTISNNRWKSLFYSLFKLLCLFNSWHRKQAQQRSAEHGIKETCINPRDKLLVQCSDVPKAQIKGGFIGMESLESSKRQEGLNFHLILPHPGISSSGQLLCPSTCSVPKGQEPISLLPSKAVLRGR